MTYTEKEIKLYEKLAKVSCIRTEIMGIIGMDIGKIIGLSKEKKWFEQLIGNFFELDKVISRANIPKKFLILNSLKEEK